MIAGRVSLDPGQYSRLRDFLNGEGEWEGDEVPCDELSLTESDDDGSVLVVANSGGYRSHEFVLPEGEEE